MKIPAVTIAKYVGSKLIDSSEIFTKLFRDWLWYSALRFYEYVWKIIDPIKVRPVLLDATGMASLFIFIEAVTKILKAGMWGRRHVLISYICALPQWTMTWARLKRQWSLLTPEIKWKESDSIKSWCSIKSLNDQLLVSVDKIGNCLLFSLFMPKDNLFCAFLNKKTFVHFWQRHKIHVYDVLPSTSISGGSFTTILLNQNLMFAITKFQSGFCLCVDEDCLRLCRK